MFKAAIPETLKLHEAPSHGISIFEYDSNRIGAKAYRELMALKRSILGNNRLAQGIFSKTEPEEESLIKNHHSWLKILDNLLKRGKQKHVQKIAKEVWVQALLELFRAMPID